MKKNILGDDMGYTCQFCGAIRKGKCSFKVECNVCGETKASCFYCWRYDYSPDNPKFDPKYENKCTTCRGNNQQYDSTVRKESKLKVYLWCPLDCAEKEKLMQIREARKEWMDNHGTRVPNAIVIKYGWIHYQKPSLVFGMKIFEAHLLVDENGNDIDFIVVLTK